MTSTPGRARTGQTTVESIQSSLRRKVTEGSLAPGTRLVDQTVAQEYGVSRNTVREALRLLSAEGLLVSVRNAGYSVRVLGVPDIRDLYVTRRVLETGAVLRSSSSDDAALAAVEQAARAAGEELSAGTWPGVGTASLEFHRAIVGLAGSPSLDRFFATVCAQLRLAFALLPDEADFQRPWVERDQALAELIVTGAREQAARELEIYLYESETQVIDGVRAAQRARGVAC